MRALITNSLKLIPVYNSNNKVGQDCFLTVIVFLYTYICVGKCITFNSTLMVCFVPIMHSLCESGEARMRLMCGVRTCVVRRKRNSGEGRTMKKLFLTPGRRCNVRSNSQNGLVSTLIMDS